MRSAECKIIMWINTAIRCKIRASARTFLCETNRCGIILHFAFCILHFYHSPMDCIMPFRAVFMGSLSGSLAEGSPLQSQS